MQRNNLALIVGVEEETPLLPCVCFDLWCHQDTSVLCKLSVISTLCCFLLRIIRQMHI